MKYVPGTFVVVPEVHRLAGKNPILQSVFMWICHFLGESGNCWPSQRTLAKLSGTSVNSVKKYLDELEELGILKRERRFENGAEISSSYYIDIGKGISAAGGGVSTGEGGVPHQMATNYNQLELNKKKKTKKPIEHHPDTQRLLSLFSSEVSKRKMVYDSMGEHKSAQAILNDEAIKTFVLEKKIGTLSKFVVWIFEGCDSWHAPRMNSLRYFHSNWAKIANLNVGKLPLGEGNDEGKLERAKKLLNIPK